MFDAYTGPENQAAPDSDKKSENLRDAAAKNEKLFNYMGLRAPARLSTESEARYTVFEDGLETYLRSDWPAWVARRKELIRQSGSYVEGKHVPAYAEAARTASGEPMVLHSLLENTMALTKQPIPQEAKSDAGIAEGLTRGGPPTR
ncbi:hypothetical protein [Streptomyces sp. AC512_CC834]|uniref:hypothetical protein n=1 Tax=Streptomyces sp. AC512_CC834 TaxID=2823691 RepID=UPI001C2602D8|nr:hypothetical protein [Streptomyces sp. AC512_CC834]